MKKAFAHYSLLLKTQDCVCGFDARIMKNKKSRFQEEKRRDDCVERDESSGERC